MKPIKKDGFTLIELLIVIAIIAIILSIASFAWQRYVNNTNLRTAARDIAGDISLYKAKAMRETRPYAISFTTGAGSTYTISANAVAGLAAVNVVKSLDVYGSGIQISNVTYTGSTNTILARGTCDAGTVTVSNNRGSTANITTNVMGKQFSEFVMQ